MAKFLRNLAYLVALGVILLIVFPGIMKQVFSIYNGLGILPVIVILVILAALPAGKRRRSR
jgi:hypothetical protein